LDEIARIFAPFGQHSRRLAVKRRKNASRVLQVESEQSNDITDRDVFIFGQQRPMPSFAGFGPKNFFGETHMRSNSTSRAVFLKKESSVFPNQV
jgi:hypothetical protein